jgi:hypothetical protein
MSGQFQQANADRDLLKKQAAAGGARVGAGAGVSGVGFKSGGGMGQAPSLYQHGLTPDTSAYSGGGAGAAVYPSSGAGIQQPWPTLDQPGQYDTYDVNTQQGYNTNDPGYQDPGYDTYDLYSQQGYNSYDQGYSGGGDWFS